MGMAILPTFPLKPQDAHVSDSNIGLMSRPVPSPEFSFPFPRVFTYLLPFWPVPGKETFISETYLQ